MKLAESSSRCGAHLGTRQAQENGSVLAMFRAEGSDVGAWSLGAPTLRAEWTLSTSCSRAITRAPPEASPPYQMSHLPLRFCRLYRPAAPLANVQLSKEVQLAPEEHSIDINFHRQSSNFATRLKAQDPWSLASLRTKKDIQRSPFFPWGRIDKVNAELVTLTYGTIVAQLCKDFESDYVEVNKQLDRMGYNIGLRLIEDYLAKSNTMRRCSNFRETAEMIAKVGFKIFLNITPTITNWTNDNKQFSLVFEENPLADFVELPDDGRAQDELWYSNIFCGVLRGALEMVQMQVEAHFISDILRGNDTTEMRISLIRYIDDELPPEDD
ncbi:hypothetical protein G7054_g233 [Neopestalotiopsis clavispora]|nr:hypothetical protein G7054_g233 [Neopestalotiopsis clavispora]